MNNEITKYAKVRYVGTTSHQEIAAGDVGYVIEDYGDGNYEVEFSRPDGTTRALVVLSKKEIEVV